jgi:hypothetical protein
MEEILSFFEMEAKTVHNILIKKSNEKIKAKTPHRDLPT